MERMTPEEIDRLKLRYNNRDGSAEVLCSKAWAHIMLQVDEISCLTARVKKLNKILDTAQDFFAEIGVDAAYEFIEAARKDMERT